MSKKRKVGAVIESQRMLAPGIYDAWLVTDLAKDAKPGQFIGVYPNNKSTLLPRPISICEIDAENSRLRLVYRAVGQGTTEFSGWQPGDQVEVLGVLGNGFPLDKADENTKSFLIGGGIGVPPILELSKQLPGTKQIVMGYRDANNFLKDEFAKNGTVYVATDDGSVGTHGTVMDAIEANGLDADVIYACGPMPMLKAIKTWAEAHDVPAYISLEERMACGVGACLGCVCKTTHKDAHSHVNNARICTDGPVFEAREVDI